MRRSRPGPCGIVVGLESVARLPDYVEAFSEASRHLGIGLPQERDGMERPDQGVSHQSSVMPQAVPFAER